jgi:hypothetical protein
VKRLDPLALAFFGGALALLAGLVLYVVFFKTPEPAQPVRAFDFLERLRSRLEGAVDQLRDKPKPPPAKPAAAPPPQPAPAPPKPSVVPTKPAPRAAAPAGKADDPGWPVWHPPAGMTWVYRVTVEPPVWQDAVLEYKTVQQGGALIVYADFRHAKGSMKFQLGSFERAHPSHANTRFPGFFMYTAYFGERIRMGQKVAWEWPWQLPGGGVKAGRVKRYEGVLVESGSNPGPVEPGTTLLKIEGTLSYIDGGRVEASARETLWYSGKSGQLARVEREGRTPDEGVSRIVAQLVELR